MKSAMHFREENSARNNIQILSSPVPQINSTFINKTQTMSSMMPFERDSVTGVGKNSVTNIATISWPSAGKTSTEFQNESSLRTFRLNVKSCNAGIFTNFTGTHGEITGLHGTTNSSFIDCKWQIFVSKNLHIIVKIDQLMMLCIRYFRIIVWYSKPYFYKPYKIFDCISLRHITLIPIRNIIYFQLLTQGIQRSLPRFKISFSTSTESLLKLKVKISLVKGYISSPAYDGKFEYSEHITDQYIIIVSGNQTLILSFESFSLPVARVTNGKSICKDHVSLYSVNEAGNKQRLWKKCNSQYIPPEIHNKSVALKYVSIYSQFHIGFKMKFSFSPRSNEIKMLKSGMFNCTWSNYKHIKEHVHCNMERECVGKEDEGGHCPFSSTLCDGEVAVNEKCYMFFQKKLLYWKSARAECESKDLTLATMKTEQEWKAFLQLYSYGARKQLAVFVGLTSHNNGIPGYYRQTPLWVDNTINYNSNVLPATRTDFHVCAIYSQNNIPMVLEVVGCTNPQNFYFVCETSKMKRPNAVQKKDPLLLKPTYISNIFKTFLQCPLGHMTNSFLACHAQSQCGNSLSKASCKFAENESHTSVAKNTINTFQCGMTKDRVPYTFVCDFNKHCFDNTDEDFCIHDKMCLEFTCINGQCILLMQMCDRYRDCEDGSDETRCSGTFYAFFPFQEYIPPPAVILHSASGTFTQIPMSESASCPKTHFRCAGEMNYCLPVYVICNGVYDCLGQEDESGCDSSVLCPGFYRCWDSSVCLHLHHVCDGWPQCPRHDDERICDFVCPHQCQCQGLAFVCDRAFSASHFLDLRYLDASRSDISLDHLENNTYLVWVDLTGCKIRHVPILHLPNLKTFTLADNLLNFLQVELFKYMINLKTLELSRNPLIKLTSINISFEMKTLENVDLSQTWLEKFDKYFFVNFPSIRYLNISFSHLKMIDNKGFRGLTNLSSLDLRGCPLEKYNTDMFKGLKQLTVILTSNFRFCCKMYLPKTFQETNNCIYTPDSISSCEDMIHSPAYRLFLWIIGVIGLTGNICGYFYKTIRSTTSHQVGLNVFVTNLFLANFLMAVHIVVVSSADVFFRSRFILWERVWVSSAVRKAAGSLAFVGTEVAAFCLALITVDRVIVLRCPSTTLRFLKRSAVCACICAWLAGISLVTYPLLPTTNFQDVFGHSALGVPLPLSTKHFKGQSYFFVTISVLNFILYLFNAVGQTIIYFSIEANLLTTDNTKKTQDMIIARRLVTVVVSDFVCSFPIGLLGLLASGGVVISREVNVFIAIFVFPVNSALNSILYSLNLLIEKRRRSQEIKLLTILKSRPVSKQSNQTKGLSSHFKKDSRVSYLTVEEAVLFMNKSVAANVITIEEVITYLETFGRART